MMLEWVNLRIFAGLAHSLLVLFRVNSQSLDEDRTLIQALVNDYRANVASLEYAVLRFTHTEGTASDCIQVENDQWNALAAARGVFGFRDDKYLYERVFSVSDMLKYRSKLDDGSFALPFVSSRVLGNAEKSLYDLIDVREGRDEPVHVAQINPGMDAIAEHARLPLQLRPEYGSEWFVKVSDMYLGGKDNVILRQVKKEGGIIHLKYTRGDAVCDFEVDADHGAIPIRTHISEQRRLFFSIISDLRYVGNRAWLPHRRTFFQGMLGENGRVSRIDCDEYVIDTPPKDGFFKLSFPRATSMVDVAVGAVYPPSEHWSLDSLPPKSGPGVEPLVVVGTRFSQGSDMPPRPNASISSHLLALVGVVFVAASAVLYVRRRVRARPGRGRS